MNKRERNTKRGLRSKEAVEYRKIKRSINRNAGRNNTRKQKHNTINTDKESEDIPSRPPGGAQDRGKGEHQKTTETAAQYNKNNNSTQPKREKLKGTNKERQEIRRRRKKRINILQTYKIWKRQ